MVARKPKQPTQLETDATEFGVGVRCGGWRLGLLVARNVAPGKAGRPKGDDNRSLENEKISMNAFAELAGVSSSAVKYYYDAWQLAAKAHLVPPADECKVGDDEICIDADAIEDEDDPKTQWGWFYSMARNPPKPKEVEKKQDSKAKAESKETDESEEDSDDESDSVDEDFGITQFSKEDAAEADTANQRVNLLDALETLRSVIHRVEESGVARGENDSILSQIASAAMDLSTSAMALAAKAEVSNG